MKKHLEQLKKEFDKAKFEPPFLLFVSAADYSDIFQSDLLIKGTRFTYNSIHLTISPDLKQGEYITNIPQKFKSL